jgi:4-amino-4-deoxy-L-arabinose transferase-like glycosyltransferase
MGSVFENELSKGHVKRRINWGVALLVVSFVLRGVFLNVGLPYGDPLDEPYHFGYAAFLETAGRPPGAAELSMPAEVLNALAWLPRSNALPGTHVSWKEFAAMGTAEQAERFREAFHFDRRQRAFVAPNYEAQQPPLAYIPAAAVLRFSGNATLDRRLLALRLLATVFSSLSVPLAFAFFRRFLPRKGALAATAAFVAFPGLGAFVGRFTNDALALPIVAAILVVLADVARGRFSGRKAVLLAVLLAAGCWTKLYVLLVLPAAPIVALFAPRNRRLAVFRRAVSSCAAALLLVIPWFVRQHGDTGDWLGLTPSKQAVHVGIGLLDRIHALPDLLHLRFAIVFERTFLWPGTWSAMGAPAAVTVVLVAALVVLILRPMASGSGRSPLRRRTFLGAASVLPLFAAGHVAYASTYAAVSRQRGLPPSAGPDGWFFLILLPVILLSGCARGGRAHSRLLLAAAGIFLAAEAVIVLGVLPAVYAGWIEPNGSNAPFVEYVRILGHPEVALSTFTRLGLAQTPEAGLVCLLAGSLLAMLAGAMLSILRPRRLARLKAQ